MAPPIDRRSLLIGGALAGLGIACGDERRGERPPETGTPKVGEESPIHRPPNATLPPLPNPSTDPAALPTRAFGKTGAEVTILGLGGAHAAAAQGEGPLALIEQAYAKGIRFFDSAHVYDYNQANLGQVLEKRRAGVFLQTKTYARDRDAALRDLENSLRLMRTDYLDSWLFHDVRRHDEVDQILAPGGALEAYTEAVEQKMVRFIGASCHSAPDILQRLIEAHPLDCVTMSLNAADAYEKPFGTTVLPVANAKEMGIVVMKPFGYGHLLRAITAKEAFSWVLSQKVSVAIVGANALSEIDQNTEVARTFAQLAEAELADISLRVKDVSRDATFFRWADSHTL